MKGPWTKAEDKVVFDMVTTHGVGNIKWSVIASKLPGRIGKQCRERWFNHLDPTISKGPRLLLVPRLPFACARVLIVDAVAAAVSFPRSSVAAGGGQRHF